MTSLILENADLNRLFPKCRPKNGLASPSSSGCSSIGHKNGQQTQTTHASTADHHQQHHHHHRRHIVNAAHHKLQQKSDSLPDPGTDDMIDLDRDNTTANNTDRCRKRANGRKKSLRRSSTIIGSNNFASDVTTTETAPASNTALNNAKASTSSSSSSASARSEDVTHYGSDQQNQSQQDDSGTEESPVYILTSAKGDRSYKLRDSRIIEIAGGREVFSQSRGKVAARKPRFLSASNSLTNDDSQSSDNVTKLSLKKNNKSPNRQSVWELRSRCSDNRKHRVNREVTETVFASEVHSVKRNPNKSLLDYDSPKINKSYSTGSSHLINNYDSLLNSNNVGDHHSVIQPKSIADLDYGLTKNCLDYQPNHNSFFDNMGTVNDGEIVVFDDIDENWQNLRLDVTSNNSENIQHIMGPTTIMNNVDHERVEVNHRRTPPENLSSSLCSSPSPTTTYHKNSSDFFKMATPASDCETEYPPTNEHNHKPSRVIGDMPLAEYTESPKRYGLRDNSRLPSLLSSPSSVYVAPRPGFPQRVLPNTPNQMETNHQKEENMTEIVVENSVIEADIIQLDDPITVTNSSVNNTNTSPINLLNDKDDEEKKDDNSLKQFALPTENLSSLESLGGSTFDYLYEFSETRKVLEEFFKTPAPSEEKDSNDIFPFQDLDYELRRQGGSSYVGQRLATVPPSTEEVLVHESPKKQKQNDHENNFLDLSVGTTGSSEDLGETEVGLQVGHSRNFTLSPETTECDSNCGDLDSEVSLMMMDNELMPASGLLGSVNDLHNNSDSLRIYTSMPVLEDGLSSGHASDTDNNNPTVILMKRQINEIEKEIIQRTRNDLLGTENENNTKDQLNHRLQPGVSPDLLITKKENNLYNTSELQLDGLDPLGTPPPPAPQGRQSVSLDLPGGEVEAAIKDIRMALQRTKTLPVKSPVEEPPEPSVSPIWIPSLLDGRRRICTESNSEDSEVRRNADDVDLEVEEVPDEEEADTDLETDRLLGQQRTDDQGFYDDKGWRKPKSRTLLPSMTSVKANSTTPKRIGTASAKPVVVVGGGPSSSSTSSSSMMTSLTTLTASLTNSTSASTVGQLSQNLSSSATLAAGTGSTSTTTTGTTPTMTTAGHETLIGEKTLLPSATVPGVLTNSGLEVSSPDDRVQGNSPVAQKSPPAKNSPTSPPSLKEPVKDKEGKKKTRNKEVLIEGVLFRARYLGSTQLVCEGQPTKSTRMCQAEEAVSRIKALAPDGESQPSTEVDLFISTEKIMVLNTDLKEIMMDHALRTISYIADIGDLVVLMARRRFVPHEMEEAPKINRTPKMICHVFESEEAQFIAQAIGRAFQAAYVEFLKANGIEDHSFVKEMDYQEVLNSQEIFGDELQMFAKKEMQKEVVVPKAKGEILGVVIVESGWGSMLPTVVIANLAPAGAAARCGQLNIGDQIIAINGVSLVGLPLSTCQNYIKNSKNQTVVKLTVVPCAPVVEVKIKRPDTKYQLGFSVQNGVICSLLRGGIAERGGVRVGHRIIEINNQSVVAVPHEKIVNLLATSVGEILMKTMPTSMFRLLTGQESPVYI